MSEEAGVLEGGVSFLLGAGGGEEGDKGERGRLVGREETVAVG